MRALLFHCKEFGSVITGLSSRPEGVVHGEIRDKNQSMTDCVLALVTIECGDTSVAALQLSTEIIQFAEDVKHPKVFLCPFAHLSNNLAKPKDALSLLQNLRDELNYSGMQLTEGHFGSDKELLIHIYGHPGNARYREF